MEATPSSIPGSNISAANDDVWFKFNAEKNVYRVTIYDAINEGEIFHARYVLYKDLDSTSSIDLELVIVKMVQPYLLQDNILHQF